jgi:hypothetical protein
MKKTAPVLGFSRRWRVVTSVFLFAFAFTLLAAMEPGPEADGVYSCGKSDKDKYVELGKLELKGRTYRTWSEKDTLPSEKREFRSFKTDGKGNIQWAEAFAFLSHDAHIAGGTSTYSVGSGEKPSILINYSENHATTFMVCQKE